MAIVVVHLLEAVEIDHRQRDFLVPVGDVQNVFMQRVPVGQAGQHVSVGAQFQSTDTCHAVATKEEQRGGVDQDRGNHQATMRSDDPLIAEAHRQHQCAGHDARHSDGNEHQSDRGQMQGLLRREHDQVSR